jgi:L-fucose isomerase-like protein
MEVYRSGRAKGYLGESEFTEDDVRAATEQMRSGRSIDVDRGMMEKAARLYHAYRAIIRANGYTSGAFRCWPEQNEPYIGVSACMAMGLLLANEDIASASCESDWPTAVVQTAATLLSGRPAPCLDWINYTGGSPVIQLGHCGMGICGSMAAGRQGCGCETVGLHPVIRQGGGTMGPVHMGQFEYGPKTGVCITRDRSGNFEVLVFRGESSEKSARGLKYSAADMEVANHKKLNRIVLKHGFPHHLAVALGDISEDMRMLCELLEIDYINPDDAG